MTPQEIFDTVAAHLLTQGKRAERFCDEINSQVCVYRATDGSRCAAGCLIPDDLYRPEMEDKTAAALCHAFDMPRWFVDNISLIGRLQSIHDGYFPDQWRRLLFDLAIEANLDDSVLREA